MWEILFWLAVGAAHWKVSKNTHTSSRNYTSLKDITLNQRNKAVTSVVNFSTNHGQNSVLTSLLDFRVFLFPLHLKDFHFSILSIVY